MAVQHKAVDVVITTYNNKGFLTNVMESVLAQDYPNLTCWVVDDHSQDGTVDFLAKHFPSVKVITKSKRSGPASSRNIAIQASSGEYIVTLDDDVELTPNWIFTMVRVIEEDQTIGIATGKLLFADNMEKINAAGGGLSKFGIGYDIGIGQDKALFSTQRQVFYGCTAAMIFTRILVKTIGGFDESYFYLCEDTDFGWRANIAGFKVIYVPNAIAYHKFSFTIGQQNPLKEYLGVRNSIRTILKNFDRSNLLIALIDRTISLSKRWWKLSLQKGKPDLLVPKGILWNVIHIVETLRKRQTVQKLRKVDDCQILELVSALWLGE